MAETLHVSLPIQQTAQIIHHAVVDGSFTGQCIDTYTLPAPQGKVCLVQVYEKHYYRAGNRLTLTVVLDDFEGNTRVHTVGGGGGEGFLRFDWGAANSFASVVSNALAGYRV